MPQVEVAEQAGVGADGRARPSEDVVVVLPSAVILLDGATSTTHPGGPYAVALAAQLAGRLVAAPEVGLVEHLAGAIRAVARHHGYTPGDSPSSTVAIARWDSSSVEVLVLADSPVVVFHPDGRHTVVSDDRLRRLRPIAPERVGELRNREGGFWVAEAVPAAAREAVVGRWALSEVSDVVLASDGVSCGVDDYGVLDWGGVLEMARRGGLYSVLDVVRGAEEGDPDLVRWPRGKVHDDQALVWVNFSE
ncbi:protein phosphatase 2C domain-containing protein [Actinokineospora sp. NPDC004072]